ncbi:hypothetical protein BOTNAR_0595g00030 [Botryotinia narcissicola]|uniref:Uncharacterized protein n=1 Tax=Botryotinia narcissicola TaxID=278944 RepID=A0A4Z1HBY4_9HELO|nr:hypothetical protein BOTNAR_0595g00030 [Botryotinia narcissicola]
MRDDKNESQCNGTPTHQGSFRQPGRSYEIISPRHMVVGCDSEKRAIVRGSRSEFSYFVDDKTENLLTVRAIEQGA